MFLVAYIGDIPILGIPACGMYAKTTVFDLVLPRILLENESAGANWQNRATRDSA